MTNTITFNELEMLQAIEKLFKDSFKTTYWFNLFEKNDVEIITENYGKYTNFPCIYVEILNPRPYGSTNTEMESYTEFDFEINCYNKKSNVKDKREIGILINNKIKEVLQQNYGFRIQTNLRTPSPDETLYRRTIRGRAIIENSTKTLYRAN